MKYVLAILFVKRVEDEVWIGEVIYDIVWQILEHLEIVFSYFILLFLL